MNRILFVVVFFFVQGVASYAQSPVALPSASKSVNGINYVRTWDVVAPVTSSTSLTTGSGVTTARMTTQYLDGLGRPLQTVVKKGSLITDPSNPLSSANAKDLVIANSYDDFGREQYQYLPFAASTTGNNTAVSNGHFKLNPFQGKTVLHELYRLTNSAVRTTGATGAITAAETKAAATFAERAAEFIGHIK